MEAKSSRHSSHLISRLLGRWRWTDHTAPLVQSPAGHEPKMHLTKQQSFVSSCVGEDIALSEEEMEFSSTSGPANLAQNNLAANLDQRYGGQYLTPEQLPEFCDQLHHLVEMIRNIQSYSKVTGEYPSALESRLSAEAREVAALAAEARNARESVARARAQRRAVRAQRREIARHLAALREEEVRELENAVRMTDRKLYKSWENLREAIEASEFDNLLEEVKGKQNALDCLVRLIENRRSTLQLLSSSASATPPRPPLPLLPSPAAPSTPASYPPDQNQRGRYFTSKRPGPYKRRRKEKDIPSRSMPVSNEPSQHSTVESSSRLRPSSICAINNQRPGIININPMTVPFELINQSGIPANMLPSMGSNSNHNLTLNGIPMPSFIPFRFSARQYGPQSEIRVTTSDRDHTGGDVVFVRINDQGNTEV